MSERIIKLTGNDTALIIREDLTLEVSLPKSGHVITKKENKVFKDKDTGYFIISLLSRMLTKSNKELLDLLKKELQNYVIEKGVKK